MNLSPFNIPFIARTRRNHALEHATIHLLNKRYPHLRLVGWSTPLGFYIYGDVPTSAVETAANEALSRLRRGEHHLAIHPRCGTNLVTASSLVGLLAFLTMLPGDKHSRRTRLPLVMLVSTLALMAAQSLGPLVQEHITTDTSRTDLGIAHIEQGTAGTVAVHRIQVNHGEQN